MAKPRIFISSTCFDLTDARETLTELLNDYGFEVLNSQHPHFGVDPILHSHTACIEAVKQCDYMVLIIGCRYGGTYIGSTKSITNEEFRQAVKMGIPVLIFVDKKVEDTIKLWKKNPTADFSGVVDNVKIYDFVDYIRAGSSNNWIFPYNNVSDIKVALKAQFAHYLLLYSKSVVAINNPTKTEDTKQLQPVAIPHNFNGLAIKRLGQEEETGLINGLKDLHSIISHIHSSNQKEDAKKEKLKALWVIARYGEIEWDGQGFEINNDIFKDYAWSTSKGKRINTQLGLFGAICDYDYNEEDGSIKLTLRFKNENEDVNTASALSTYVSDLYKKHGEDSGLELFLRGDMRIYSEFETENTGEEQQQPIRVKDGVKAKKKKK